MAETEISISEKIENIEISDPKDEVVTSSVAEAIVKGVNPYWTVDSFSAKLGTQLGDNFMSVMYSVSILIICEKTGKKDTLEVMLKTMPRNPLRVEMIKQTQAFVKETKMYLDVLPVLIAFQEERGLSKETIYKPFPICYSAFLSPDGTMDYIALQDLRIQNYNMASRHGGLGFEECKIVMRAIGKFHALSYAKYEGNSEKILSNYPYLEEKTFSTDAAEMTKSWILETFEREAKMIREKSPTEEAAAIAMEKIFAKDFWNEMAWLTKAPLKNTAVITHGDCWTNNFLFHNNSTQSENMLPLKFIDFQMSRVGVRSLDIGYFLYTSPQIYVLNNHEEDLLRIYYNEFQGFLTILGYVDSESTFEELCDEFDKYRLYGISIGCMLAPIISAQSGDIPDMETMSGDMDELLSEENKDMWFGTMNKEQITHDKILNIAKLHLPKLRK